ncbi:MAG: nucleotidyltransferase domain-containing protein [Roseburia sp.]|nr:nucleotidyltransferase domain-containing protein [Roseburia sp.]MCM1278620.1 nucleotidyltransferase domain-containing protein [Robinsoniella sp.]
MFNKKFKIAVQGEDAMCTKKQLDNIYQQVAMFYRSVYGDDIVAIFLYGSYARGNYDEESDIDIVAIVKGERFELQNKLKLIWDKSADVGIENDVVVSPAVIPFDEYEEYKEILPYYMNIRKEGKRIG